MTRIRYWSESTMVTGKDLLQHHSRPICARCSLGAHEIGLVRPQLSVRNRGTASPCAHAPSTCRPRCSSTFSPSNLAALLRPSPLPSSSLPSPSPLDGETLTINGYVRTVRKQKRIAFAAIGDGSTLQTVQAVLAPQLAEGSVIPSSSPHRC